MANRQNPSRITAERLFVSRREAAKTMGIGLTKLDEMVKDGTIPCLRHGGLIRIPLSVLQDLVTERRSEAN